MTENFDTKYGLPAQVVYCQRCVMSNQRPASIPEFRHTPDRRGAKYMQIDSEGVCDACRHAEEKERIDWAAREQELLRLLDRYRRTDGAYDCLVPGSPPCYNQPLRGAMIIACRCPPTMPQPLRAVEL